jgi:hypothetical protein
MLLLLRLVMFTIQELLVKPRPDLSIILLTSIPGALQGEPMEPLTNKAYGPLLPICDLGRNGS